MVTCFPSVAPIAEAYDRATTAIAACMPGTILNPDLVFSGVPGEHCRSFGPSFSQRPGVAMTLSQRAPAWARAAVAAGSGSGGVVFSEKRMNKARHSTPIETSCSRRAGCRSRWSSGLAIAASRRSSASGNKNDAIFARVGQQAALSGVASLLIRTETSPIHCPSGPSKPAWKFAASCFRGASVRKPSPQASRVDLA